MDVRMSASKTFMKFPLQPALLFTFCLILGFNVLLVASTGEAESPGGFDRRSFQEFSDDITGDFDYFTERESGDDDDQWIHEGKDHEDVTLQLHSPSKDFLTIHIGDRHLRLRMVQTDGIVAQGAQLRRYPDGTPEPLLVRRQCHYQLLDGTVPVGSLHTCHPLGHHAMLMLEDSLIDIVPKASLQEKVEPQRGKSSPSPPSSVEDADELEDLYEEEQPRQEASFPFQVARNVLDHVKFRDVVSGHLAREYFIDQKRSTTFNKRDKDKSWIFSKEGSAGKAAKERRKRSTAEDFGNDEGQPEIPDFIDSPDEEEQQEDEDGDQIPDKSKREYLYPLKLELALFLDAVVLEKLDSFYTKDQGINLILSLMNNVQSFYHSESLGRRVDLSITQLHLLRTQPTDLPTHGGDRYKLLESFCRYQNERIYNAETMKTNWDLAVYLSGVNLIAVTPEGNISDTTMGLTYTGGICKPRKCCVISEFGTFNSMGRPFPSAGAVASLILTHEIGHSLGLRHDGSMNDCSGYSNHMMAPGRGRRGGTTWSRCSKEAIRKQNGHCLDNSIVDSTWDKSAGDELAGQVFDAVAQCQLFFRDRDATLTWPTSLHELCSSTQCSSPHRLRPDYAGPAFEGTYCGRKSWCRMGQCVPWTNNDMVTVVPGGYGKLEEGPCVSACLEGGTGWMETRKPCNNPKPRNSDQGCVTTSYTTVLCDDTQVCGAGPRHDIQSAMNKLCGKVSQRYPDAKAKGYQMPYSGDNPSLSCLLYCFLHSKPDEKQAWAPKFQFMDDPTVPTHLPPGAPCHVDSKGVTYRCLHRTCVPEEKDNFVIPKHRDLAGLYEYRDPQILDDLVIDAEGFAPVPPGPGIEDYPHFDLDNLV